MPEEGNLNTLGDLLTGALSSPLTRLVCWVASRKSLERNWRVPTWESARREAADLLLVALEGLVKLPPAEIGKMLEINEQGVLEALVALQDSDEPPGEEADDDPLMRCINSTRGRTLHAVVAFQASLDNWARSVKRDAQGASQLHSGVSQLFDSLLNEERSPADRCVFGWKLPYLYRLDPEWVNDHLKDIFPSDEPDYAIWRASWDAYVGFNPLFTSIWDLLKSYYVQAVDRVGNREYQRVGPGDPDEKLGDHVFMAWFVGSEDAESILASYLSSSDDILRSHLVWFASRVLESKVSGEGLREDEWERLERFWSDRINERGAFGVVACEAKEASAFVPWLTHLPSQLPRLKPLIAGVIIRFPNQEDHMWEKTSLLEYVCAQSDDYPVEAAELMAAMAKRSWPQWLSGEQQASIVAALRRARLETDGEPLVKEIVDQLSLQHRFEYRQVLEETRVEN